MIGMDIIIMLVIVVIGICKGFWFVCSDDWCIWMFDGLYLFMIEVFFVVIDMWGGMLYLLVGVCLEYWGFMV